MARTSSTKSNQKTTTSKKRGPSKLLKSLPESVEHIEIVQQVAGILEDMQARVTDVKAEASKELKKLMKLYAGNYKALEKKVHVVTSEAKKQAQTSMIVLLQKWHEHKEKLPAPLAHEIEKLIEQIGTKAAARAQKAPKTKKETSTPKAPKSAELHKSPRATKSGTIKAEKTPKKKPTPRAKKNAVVSSANSMQNLS